MSIEALQDEIKAVLALRGPQAVAAKALLFDRLAAACLGREKRLEELKDIRHRLRNAMTALKMGWWRANEELRQAEAIVRRGETPDLQHMAETWRIIGEGYRDLVDGMERLLIWSTDISEL